MTEDNHAQEISPWRRRIVLFFVLLFICLFLILGLSLLGQIVFGPAIT